MKKQNKIKFSIEIIIILILFFLLIIQKQCNRGNNNQPNIITDTVYSTQIIYDTIPKLVPNYIPIIDTVLDTLFLPQNIDTTAILKDYYSKIVYIDTPIDDTSAKITIFDTISENRIVSRSVEFINRRPIIINNTQIVNTEIINKKIWNIGIGLNIGGGKDYFIAGPSLMLTTNKKSSYTINYDAVNKTGSVGVYWNIR